MINNKMTSPNPTWKGNQALFWEPLVLLAARVQTWRTNETKKTTAGAHSSSGAICSSRTHLMRMGLRNTTATALNTIMAKMILANGLAFVVFFGVGLSVMG